MNRNEIGVVATVAVAAVAFLAVFLVLMHASTGDWDYPDDYGRTYVHVGPWGN